VVFILTQFPGLHPEHTWPYFIIGAGLLLFMLGIVLNSPDMAVPACIVGGIGGLLFFMANHPHYWSAWVYAWTLIPAFVAIGMFIAWLMGAKERYSLRSILDTFLTSLVMFCILAAIFIPILKYPAIDQNILKYWPLLLVIAGVIVFIRGLFRPAAKPPKVPAAPPTPPVPEVPSIPVEESKKEASLEPIAIEEPVVPENKKKTRKAAK